MTTRLRFPTLFDLLADAPMQHAPVRVALVSGLAALASVAAVLAL